MTDEWPPGEASVGVGSRGLGGRPESGDWSTSTRSGSNVRWSDVWFRSSSNCCPPITMRAFLPPTRRGARENNVKFCSPSASFTSCGPQPYRGHKLSSPRLWIPPITTVLCLEMVRNRPDGLRVSLLHGQNHTTTITHSPSAPSPCSCRDPLCWCRKRSPTIWYLHFLCCWEPVGLGAAHLGRKCGRLSLSS